MIGNSFWRKWWQQSNEMNARVTKWKFWNRISFFFYPITLHASHIVCARKGNIVNKPITCVRLMNKTKLFGLQSDFVKCIESTSVSCEIVNSMNIPHFNLVLIIYGTFGWQTFVLNCEQLVLTWKLAQKTLKASFSSVYSLCKQIQFHSQVS